MSTDHSPHRTAESIAAEALNVAAAAGPEGARAAVAPRPPVVTTHQTRVGGRKVIYTATAGTTVLHAGTEEQKGSLFSVSYVAHGVADASARPVMFCFNGGPGSSSVWLHLGSLGPRRVDLPDAAPLPNPPFRLVDNAEGLLDCADLVFIDPVGTGFSKATGTGKDTDFHGIQSDVSSVGEFIETWLTVHGRWNSPRFLCGESYGTTRAVGLAHHLGGRGVTFNGLVLISMALDGSTFLWNASLDTAALLHLPTYAVAGWYHGKVAGESLEAVAEAARVFARGPYFQALFAGNRLTAEDRAAVLAGLERHTGVAAAHWDRHDLRMEQPAFCRHLLGERREVVGRFDARFVGEDPSPAGTGEPPDPSFDGVLGAFTAAVNTLLRGELGVRDPVAYEIFNLKANENWAHERKWWEGVFNVTDRLRTALLAQPHLKVFVGTGWYDVATPFFATEYTLDHLGRAPSLRARLTECYYPAGHMMYLHPPSRVRLRADLAAFVAAAAPGGALAGEPFGLAADSSPAPGAAAGVKELRP